MKECIIISGAPKSTFPKDIDFKNTYVYCADFGYKYAQQMGVVPDVVIGDFDTYSECRNADAKVLEYSSHKDETDTMLAVMDALKKGFNKIHIIAALGGRFDHMYANIQTLNYIFSKGAVGIIEDADNFITMQYQKEQEYKKRDGFYFSLFSFGEKVSGLTIKGTEYTAENIEFSNTFPLGVSNKIVDEYATVKKEEGILLVVYSRE